MDDTFDRNSGYHVAHIAMAQEADVVMIAPASWPNVIAKLAHGIADDMLTFYHVSLWSSDISCPGNEYTYV